MQMPMETKNTKMYYKIDKQDKHQNNTKEKYYSPSLSVLITKKQKKNIFHLSKHQDN